METRNIHQTAVEWLAEIYNLIDTVEYEQAKELEKQQIISACEYADPNHDGIGEYYYQKTFNNESK